MVVAAVMALYKFTGKSETKEGAVLMVQCYYALAYLLGCYVIIEYKPKLIALLIPLTIWIGLFININVSTASEEYKVSEYLISCMCNMFLYMMLVPSQWHINMVTFTLCMLYYLARVYYTYKKLPMELVIAVLMSIFYFSLAAKMLYSKVKDLYKLLIENKKLIKEMKKILESFPHGVIIQSRDSEFKDEVYFTNHEFQEHIYAIKNNIRELSKIKISFPEKNDEYEEVHTDLCNFLKRQEERLKELPVLKKNNVKINCSDALEALENPASHNTEEGGSNECVKNFNVKTLRVNWEGNENSFMHVFIDISDIIRLEQAKEDIRCQKVMFASVSHEFRTPLNAILNSYRFIKSSNEELLGEMNDRQELDRLSIQK